jgi:uncharacterized membrane protein
MNTEIIKQGKNQMINYKRTAITVGALFLIAMVASLVGGIWLESIITAPDYLSSISDNEPQIVTGVMLELVNGLSVLGIGVLMFPVFKKYSEAAALGYAGIRITELVIIVAGLISPLALITISREFLAASAADAATFQVVGTALLAVREHLVGQLLGIFFSLSALVLYILLYRTKLVPQWLALWGLIGGVLILAWNLVEAFGISVSFGMILALPMILNEIFLGIWLIVKGFNQSAIGSEAA